MPPCGPRKLKITFGTKSLTHYGGLYLLHRFFSRLRLRTLLTQEARLLQRNNRYSLGEMLLALLYPMILGLERIETTQLLRQNGVFQYLTGLPSYPEATTLRRFLLRVAPGGLPRVRVLHDRLLHRMTVRPHPPSRLIFDVDSTVLVVYGKQERARIGYNPNQAWPTLLSPSALLRGPEQGLLAWRVAARRCPYRQRDARPPAGVFRKDSGRGPSGDYPR